MGRITTLFLLSATCGTAALTPYAQWPLVPGAEDLIQAGNWGCVSGVTAAPNLLQISAGGNYNTVINSSGPLLRVTGDFSVLATLSTSQTGPGAFLTLVGALNSGDWWNGLKRLDVGVSGHAVQIGYWTGSSANSTPVTAAGTVALDSVTFEVARIGSQIVVYLNGTEAARFPDPGLFSAGQVFLGYNVPPNGTLQVSAMAAAAPAGSATFADPTAQVIAGTGSGLRDFSGQQGFLIGAAVNPSLLTTPGYAPTLGQQVNLVVPENAMKFADTEPGPYQYNFCQADQVVRFAQANGMKLRGHTLVWQQALPDWLTKGTWTPAEAASILQDHIRTVMGHFKGKLIVWDVVNEAIAYGAPYGPQPSYWLNQLGSGYVEQAFRWAHEADPDVKLFYNDTGGEGLGAKSDAVYNLVSGLVNKGVPVNGVGLQMHVDLAHAPSPADVSANIQRLGRLGLEVHITEMDVRLPVTASGPSAADLAAQGAVYSGILGACLANSNCTALLTWGVSDANSWIPGQYPGFGAALLFDNQFQAKPAVASLASALRSAAAKPRVFYGGIVVHGGIAQVVSPGSLVDAYGSALAPGVAQSDSQLPVILGKVQVLVNGVAAPMLYVSPAQLIFQLPYEIGVGAASVVVRTDAGDSPASALTVAQAAPSILTYSGNRAVVVNSDGTVNSATNCAAPGSVAVMYAIGSGPVDHPVPTGAFAPLSPLANETLPTSVTVAGQPATVLFAGLAPTFAGLMQINFQLPPGLPAGVAPSDAPVQLTIGTAAGNSPVLCVGRQTPGRSAAGCRGAVRESCPGTGL